VRERRSKQKFGRKGFAVGLFAGLVFVAYKAFRYPGSLNRSDAMLCVAVVLAFGLVGGVLGATLGAVIESIDRDN
jgi:uncharacterized membrane protein